MELKFGKMLGEDPKLTLAKIMGKKYNPDMSDLEIEKMFYKTGGKGMSYDISEVSFDVPKKRQTPTSLDGMNLVRPVPKKLDGLNLVRPVPKKGVKFEVDNKPKVSNINRPSLPAVKVVNSTKVRVPDVILRKPSVYSEDDAGSSKASTSKSQYSMSINIGKGKEKVKNKFSDIALMRKPELVSFDQENKQKSSSNANAEVGKVVEQNSIKNLLESTKQNNFALVGKPQMLDNDSEKGAPEDTESSAVEIFSSEMEHISKIHPELNNLALVEKPQIVEKPQTLDNDSEQGTPEERYTGSSYTKVFSAEMVQKSTITPDQNNYPLVEKPQVLDNDSQQGTSDGYTGSSSAKDLCSEMVPTSKLSPEQSFKSGGASPLSSYGQQSETLTELRPFQQNDLGSDVKLSVTEASKTKSDSSNSSTSAEAVLHKPERLNQPVKRTPDVTRGEKIRANTETYDSTIGLEKLLTPPHLEELENIDWKRAEDLLKNGGREEVEVISSSTRGFVVSFGSIIGFLPYRNLAAKHKFLAVESWLRRRGLDPSMYKQNLSIIGSSKVATKAPTISSLDVSLEHNVDGEILSSNKLENLLLIYDQEKLKFLSSFVGQKLKVNVLLAERKSRRLIFSVKPKEKEELVGKKRKLMAKLSIGDVVKCCIKKIAYFGILVEVEGVPALIHQTEVSWDATLDPTSYFKVGQIVEAKVHHIDFAVERIFLSLKDIVPDPMIEAMEVVVGNNDALGGELVAAEADNEWADVESLIKELEQFEGIQAVSRGWSFLSPGLAPAFQVYMASMFENQYKLLVREGNRVQEVIVETSLGKEDIKSAISACTNKIK
ncbi:S1 motif domain-containing protein [Heracleum sosnowskyi]|uniref:S1 motif domain-containing protein n=1 Tax=Heracleum sosnowskyi TaxID=360622 RepID=A0AAD8HXG8_9APIA|nr:S1 motif domain-containing protein [Heracleum sosnowskyi]